MRGLNRNAMKYIAIAAMLVDHIGMFFIPVTTPLGVICRVIGRITAPVMCLFVAEGYRYTRSRAKYALRLFAFALISQVPYAYAHYGTILSFDFNVIFTLFAGFVTLVCYDHIKNPLLKWTAVVAVILATYPCDWGIFAPLWILGFYKAQGDKTDQTAFFCIVALAVVASAAAFSAIGGYAWYAELWQGGLFLFVPLLWAYNGERGSAHPVHKWVFYIFYPLHLAAIWLVDMLWI